MASLYRLSVEKNKARVRTEGGQRETNISARIETTLLRKKLSCCEGKLPLYLYSAGEKRTSILRAIESIMGSMFYPKNPKIQ